MRDVSFLGAGKMATAIAGGLVDRGLLPAARMKAFDVSPDAATAFSAATGVACVSEARSLLSADSVLVVAVKPQAAREALASLAPVSSDLLVVSIAAGLPLSRLATWLGTKRLIRVMPNTPLLVGEGACVFTRGEKATDEDADLVGSMLGALGLVREAPEAAMDAVTALSGSGPAYVFELVRVLTEAGRAVGLPEALALDLTVQTVAGAAAMLRAGKGSPEELRRAVTSPGGTTAAGLSVLEAGGFPDLMRRTVAAARDRSIELGKG